MAIPVLHPTTVHDGPGPGVTFRIEGELVPTLHLALDGTQEVFFEHHVILWKQPQIEVTIRKMKNAFKRALGGLPIFLTEARGQGEIAFSRDYPGQVIAFRIPHGEKIFVREHQFLAATGNIEYTFERAGGYGSMLFGSQGFFIDRFEANNGEGILWLHGNGNLYEINLASGETIDVEPGAWVYRDGSVSYTQKVFGLRTGLLGGGGNLVFNRFTGPGRVGIQSGYFESMGAGAPGDSNSNDTSTGSVGGLIGGLFKN